MGFAGIQPFLTQPQPQPQPEAKGPAPKHRSRGEVIVQFGMGGWDGAPPCLILGLCQAGTVGRRASTGPVGASAPPATLHAAAVKPPG